MYHAIRLTKGDDLKESIEKYATTKNIKAGCVLSGVGCVDHVKIRLAKAIDFLEVNDDFEIVSITGTISQDGVHIHISLSDDKGNTIGGHLSKGCIINTTCELVILELPNYTFTREMDDSTGYKELVIREQDV